MLDDVTWILASTLDAEFRHIFLGSKQPEDTTEIQPPNRWISFTIQTHKKEKQGAKCEKKKKNVKKQSLWNDFFS